MENTQLLNEISVLLKEQQEQQRQELQQGLHEQLQEYRQEQRQELQQVKQELQEQLQEHRQEQRQELQQVKQELQEQIEHVQEQLEPIKDGIKKINSTIENDLRPKINTMYDNYEYIVEKAKEIKVSESLQEDVEVLKVIVKSHGRKIRNLKKTQ